MYTLDDYIEYAQYSIFCSKCSICGPFYKLYNNYDLTNFRIIDNLLLCNCTRCNSLISTDIIYINEILDNESFKVKKGEQLHLF